MLLVILAAQAFLVIKSLSKREPEADIDKMQEYAHALADNRLYSQAIAEYDRILETGKLSEKKSANLNYLAGKIYEAKLGDYENAAARFLKAKLSKPGEELERELSLKLVECYERLGRSFDAQRELERETSTGEKPGTPGGRVVARIGKRGITLGELEEGISRLPEFAQRDINSKDKRLEFLRQYIGGELLHDSALRKGYNKDPEVLKGLEDVKKQLLVQKILQEEVYSKIEVTDSDAKLYYQAHRDEFENKSFHEARDLAKLKLQQERSQEEFDKLIARLMEAEKVQIFEDQL
ncbi:MAG: hypothetical protein AMJ41_03045 [candidate division Zixibacteria bacterium DG_27]|nr:MAG: hypothetical protein AMJ41_03045 [candidate division Zixibacteria bacterium DG_27]